MRLGGLTIPGGQYVSHEMFLLDSFQSPKLRKAAYMLFPDSNCFINIILDHLFAFFLEYVRQYRGVLRILEARDSVGIGFTVFEFA